VPDVLAMALSLGVDGELGTAQPANEMASAIPVSSSAKRFMS
jgi:hypothetical protein